MMPRPKSDTVQIAIRVPREWLKRAEEVARRESQPGLKLSRTDGFRMAIAFGLLASEGSERDPIKSGFRLINVKTKAS